MHLFYNVGATESTFLFDIPELSNAYTVVYELKYTAEYNKKAEIRSLLCPLNMFHVHH